MAGSTGRAVSGLNGSAMISAAELLDDFDAFLRKVGFYASADYLLNMAFGQRMDVLLLLYRDYMNDICFLPTLLTSWRPLSMMATSLHYQVNCT